MPVLYIYKTKLVITVPTDGLALKGARPSAGWILITRVRNVFTIFSFGIDNSDLTLPLSDVYLNNDADKISWNCMALLSFNKANLRDLIAATGLIILLKLDSNHRFFSPCDLEIWRMTFKNNRAPLLCYFKLCASFQCHRLIQTGVTVRKRLIWVKIDDFFSRVTLKFNVWAWKTIGHLFYATSSFLYHLVAIGEFKLELQSGNAQSG